MAGRVEGHDTILDGGDTVHIQMLDALQGGHRRSIDRLSPRSSNSVCSRLDTEWECSSMLSSKLLREVVH
jgi:hypothetical protein